ncbi:MAG: alpha/beta fold hydrolase [Candidatus Eisenbacteria bacterium]|uniref:Alpha/beta fold hydrolase n=1 Tax=Eiseniibacteriota bacterium TaxID=2212470 RepID=A0A849T0J6_UNCEI|nr:alpha/beta fold hydrolase [Candidatus Eisenbacteria bacterium]
MRPSRPLVTTRLRASSAVLAVILLTLLTTAFAAARTLALASSAPEIGAPAPVAPGAASLAGAWNGRLSAALRLVLHFERGAAGEWVAKLDSPDQGAIGLPLEVVLATPDSVRVVLTQAAAWFEGRLDRASGRLVGTWNQGGERAELTLEHGEIARASRPQHPVPPFPYASDSITFRNSRAGLTLAGTLTRPRDRAPHAAVVLVSGSGQQSRDEEVFEHKPFLVIADRLTRAGFAVLRYDDRGVGGSGGNPALATGIDNASDVEAAVRYLRSRPEVDARRIAIVGHSEGGILAPWVAARDSQIAALVLLAGTGVPGDSVLATQTEALMRSAGLAREEIARRMAPNRAIHREIKSGASPESVFVRAERTLRVFARTLSAAELQAVGGEERFARDAAEQSRLPWLRWFIAHDPAVDLRRVRCPVLALNGELDLQVDASINLPAIEAALRAGGNRDVTMARMPGLNHLFQTATSGAMSEYSTIEETLAPAVLDRMTAWLVARLESPR